MRFLADMGISPATMVYLCGAGYDAVHLRDQGLQKLPDAAILQKAYEENRILLTHDLDFSDLVAAGGEALPSVIIFRLRNMQPENVNRHLAMLLAIYAPRLGECVVASVTEGRVRLRSLPL